MDEETQTPTAPVEPPQTETPAADAAEKTIPYARFQQVNEELKQLKAAQQSKATEDQTLAQRLQALESDLAREREATLRLKVASTKGLPSELVDRLRGTNEAELTSDADALLALLKPKAGPGVPLPGAPAQKLNIGTMTPAQIREARAKGEL